MDDDRLWAQLELRIGPVREVLKVVIGEEGVEDDEEGEGGLGELGMEGEDGEGFEEMDEEEFDDEDGEFDEDEDDSEEGMDEDEDEDDGDDDDASLNLGEDITKLRDPSDEEQEEEEDLMDLDRPVRPLGKNKKGKGKQRAGGHPELDDGFFSLAEFNAETEEAEAKQVSKGRLGMDEDEEDEEGDEDVDLFAPVEDEEVFEEEDLEGGVFLFILCLPHFREIINILFNF